MKFDEILSLILEESDSVLDTLKLVSQLSTRSQELSEHIRPLPDILKQVSNDMREITGLSKALMEKIQAVKRKKSGK